MLAVERGSPVDPGLKRYRRLDGQLNTVTVDFLRQIMAFKIMDGAARDSATLMEDRTGCTPGNAASMTETLVFTGSLKEIRMPA